MTVALILLVVGVLLSAFFSGSETGFYRASPIRLLLDALGGNVTAQVLHRLVSYPSLFVATVLVGNNLANYVTSLAMVIGARMVFPSSGHTAELVAPILLAPFLFVYGELLPKNLYYEAPNRLLRASGPPLVFCTALFLPVTALLYALSKGLELLAGESPQSVQLTLARRELQRVFEEGHEAGIIRPAQRGLAQGLFAVANQPLGSVAIPAGRVVRVNLNMSKADMRRLAKRHRMAVLPVEKPEGSRPLIGYVQVVDLYLDPSDSPPPLRPLLEFQDNETYLTGLMRLETSGEGLAAVTGAGGKTVGFLTPHHLSERLFRGR